MTVGYECESGNCCWIYLILGRGGHTENIPSSLMFVSHPYI